MKNRRKFIGDSAKIVGAVAVASALPLMAKDSKANPKDSSNGANPKVWRKIQIKTKKERQWNI